MNATMTDVREELVRKLREAWAKHTGVGISDERVQEAHKYGWPAQFRVFKEAFEAGVEAALAQPSQPTDEQGRPMTYWGGLKQSSQPAQEAVAYLHSIVHTEDGEPDEALSFSPESFPFSDTLPFKSIKCTPLYTSPAPVSPTGPHDLAALRELVEKWRKGGCSSPIGPLHTAGMNLGYECAANELTAVIAQAERLYKEKV